MQVGIMSGHVQRPSLEESLDAILGYGIRHMQFNMGTANVSGTLEEKIEKGAAAVKHEVAKRDMCIAALGGPANMAATDPHERQTAVEKLKILIAGCEPIGTSVIATCTGSRHPESMWRHHPDNDSPEAWRAVLETLEQVMPAAEAADVTIAFEPEINNVANTVRKSRQLIDEVGSSHLKVVMDAANIFGENDLPRMTEILDEAFELLGDHIAIAHGKDLDHGGDAGHLAAGTGKLDYAHYVSLLCELPFDVPVILHGLTEEQVPESVAMLKGHAANHQVGANA